MVKLIEKNGEVVIRPLSQTFLPLVFPSKRYGVE